jgi:hypothetical protein
MYYDNCVIILTSLPFGILIVISKISEPRKSIKLKNSFLYGKRNMRVLQGLYSRVRPIKNPLERIAKGESLSK